MYILCFVVCKNLNFLCSFIFYTAFKKIYTFVHLVYTHLKTDKRFSNNISIWHVKDYYFLWAEIYCLQVPLRLNLILMKSWLEEWLWFYVSHLQHLCIINTSSEILQRSNQPMQYKKNIKNFSSEENYWFHGERVSIMLLIHFRISSPCAHQID